MYLLQNKFFTCPQGKTIQLLLFRLSIYSCLSWISSKICFRFHWLHTIYICIYYIYIYFLLWCLCKIFKLFWKAKRIQPLICYHVSFFFPKLHTKTDIFNKEKKSSLYLQVKLYSIFSDIHIILRRNIFRLWEESEFFFIPNVAKSNFWIVLITIILNIRLIQIMKKK